MAITWDAARIKLRSSLWKTASVLSDSECDDALHASVLELERERSWLWLEAIKDSTALAVATNVIAVPADFSSPLTLNFRLSAAQRLGPPLEAITLGRLRSLASETSTGGTPSFYALSQGSFFFDCAAPVGSIFELVYTARTPDDLATAVTAAIASGNRTLQTKEAAVLALAGHYACLQKLRNEEEATRKLAIYRRILEGLESQDDEARCDQHGGVIVPDDSYQVMAWGYR